METVFRAWLIVYRALILAKPLLQGAEDTWARDPLDQLFSSPQEFSKFLSDVATNARQALVQQARWQQSSLLSYTEKPEALTFERLVFAVVLYLRDSEPLKEVAYTPSTFEIKDIISFKAGKTRVSGSQPTQPGGAQSAHPSGLQPAHPGVQPAPPAAQPAHPGAQSVDPLFGSVQSEMPNEANNCSLVRIFYATDRKQSLTAKEASYGHQRSSPTRLFYGESVISIPKTHVTGAFETPSILKLEFRPNPAKHIVLQSVSNLEEAVFLERLADAVASSAKKEAFIFVHGYKVTFQDAARRTGQIAFDLHFVGAPILYSWPSNGHFEDYFADEANATWSTPHFERFLNLIAQHSGAERIHLIAHSMGNRIVCDALKAVSSNLTSSLKLTHVVLAAPDIDADTFRELYEAIKRVSGFVTLYQSSRDKAILMSRKLHGHPRAAEPILVMPQLDTIDASAIDTDFLAHSYFSNNWPLLSDIFTILSKDTPPSNRFGLDPHQSSDGIYYAFRPNK